MICVIIEAVSIMRGGPPHQTEREAQRFMSDALNESEVRQRLSTRIIGAEYRHLPVTHSTQDDVSAAGRAGAAEGLAITADEQTRGRGRFRRSWMSPPGASLLVSVLLRPNAELLPSLSMISAPCRSARDSPRVPAA